MGPELEAGLLNPKQGPFSVQRDGFRIHREPLLKWLSSLIMFRLIYYSQVYG